MMMISVSHTETKMSGPNAPPINFRPSQIPRGGLASDTADYSYMNMRPQGAPQKAPVPARTLPRPRPQQAAMPPQAQPTQGQQPQPTPQEPIPMPRPRPDFASQVAALEALKQPGPVTPTVAGPAVTSPEDFIARVQAMENAKTMGAMPHTLNPTAPGQPAIPGVSPNDPAAIAIAQAMQTPPPEVPPVAATPPPEAMKADMAQAVANGQRAANGVPEGPPSPDALQYANVQGPGVTTGPRYEPKGWYRRMQKGQQEIPVRASIPTAQVERFARAGREGKLDKYTPPEPPEKTATNKGAKDRNEYYYKILNVRPGDKGAAAHQLSLLKQKAAQRPWELTPDEDRLLSSLPKSEGFHESMQPADVTGRFAGFEELRKASGNTADLSAIGGEPEKKGPAFKRPKFSPEYTKVYPQKGFEGQSEKQVQDYIAGKGAPAFQGSKMPTQADVNAGRKDPTAFKAQFPKYTTAPPEEDTKEEEVPEE